MSHRSYQSSQTCGSKLLQQRWDEAYYKEHRRMVATAKPMVDTSTPPKPPHVVAKWKKRQMEKERAEEIERDTYTLTCKMKKHMDTRTTTDYRKHHSLNLEKRQREFERVGRENKAMLERLQKVQPVYRISDWIDDWQRSEELTQRITAYPNPPSTHKRHSKSAPHSTRPCEPARVGGEHVRHSGGQGRKMAGGEATTASSSSSGTTGGRQQQPGEDAVPAHAHTLVSEGSGGEDRKMVVVVKERVGEGAVVPGALGPPQGPQHTEPVTTT